MIKLSVITINFNHKHFPKLCVEALEAAKTNFKFEIIFVDNGAHDLISKGFLEKAAKQGRIKLIKTHKNLGFSAGNNLGAVNATGEYLLFLNPDTTVYSDALQKMIDYMERRENAVYYYGAGDGSVERGNGVKHGHIGILGPKLIYADGVVQDSRRRFPRLIDLIAKRTPLSRLPFFRKKVHEYIMNDFDHEKICEPDWVTGAAMLISKKVFESVGGFDERYFIFMEDLDLCRKVRAKGLKVVYYPEAQINHYHQRLSAGGLHKLLTKKVFWHHIASMFKYFWKWRKG